MDNNKKSRLTIEEINNCEKCSDICKKVAIGGSIFTGISFLTECVSISILNNSNLPISWKLIIGLSTTLLMGLGFGVCEFSRDSLIAKEDMDNIIEGEKYLIYRENHDSK